MNRRECDKTEQNGWEEKDKTGKMRIKQEWKVQKEMEYAVISMRWDTIETERI